jgi:hypothetical protein
MKNIELKNIKVHLGLSEETYAYTAVVYVDGKKAVEVSNQGHGGGDRQMPVNGHGVREINDWCKATMPKWSLSLEQAGGLVSATEDEFETGLEMWCRLQVGEHLTLRDMNRIMRTKALYIKNDEGPMMEMGFRGVRKYDPRWADLVRQQNPDAVVLNELPTAKALELYKAHG